MNLTSNLNQSPLLSRGLASWGRGLLAVLSLAATHHAIAQDTTDGGLQAYQCVVLSKQGACPAPTLESPVRVEERVELGPIAKYHMYLGMDREDAIERARTQGEVPTRVLVRVTKLELTTQEKYDRLIGNYKQPKTLEEVVVGELEPSNKPATDVGG